MLQKLFLRLLPVFILCSNVLLAQASLKLISPIGGEKMQINSRQGIIWSSEGVERINISYSIDNGSSWKLLFNDISAELNIVSWNIPNLINEKVILKIEDLESKMLDITRSHFFISDEISMKGSLNKISSTTNSTIILPLGNSITYGLAQEGLQIGDIKGYRYSLYNLLTNANVDFLFNGNENSGGNYLPAGFTKNAGFPGISDGQLLTLMETGRRLQPFHGIDEQITVGPYLETYPADIILLHIGTNGNDAAGGTDANDIEGILDEIDRFETDSGRVIKVVLAKIIDRVPNESFVSTLNNNIEIMALDRVNNPMNAAYPDNIIIVDMEVGAGLEYTIDTVGTIGNGLIGDMADALHPNEKGYEKMADAWYSALSTILPTKPIITVQPEDQSTIFGETLEFNVSAEGDGPITYQWQKNTINIDGAVDTFLVLENLTAFDDSSLIRCIVSNSNGSEISGSALMLVAGENERVDANLEVFYNFNESAGDSIYDFSAKLPSYNLGIENENNVKWIPYGLSVNSSTIITSSNVASKIINNCMLTNELTLETWIIANDTIQSGPARIITVSENGSNRNFTLGQEGSKFVTRLRTSENNLNGTNPDFESSPGCAKTDLTHIVFMRDTQGIVKFYIDGQLKSLGLIEGNFSNWNTSYGFGLANEFESERPWLGKLYLMAIYSKALSEKEIIHNYNVGFMGMSNLLEVPINLAGEVENDTTVVLSWEDNEIQEDGYIIERRASSVDSTYYELDSLTTNSTVFIDNFPKYFNSYTYRVKAYNEFYQSDYSDSVKVDNIITSIKNVSIVNDYYLTQNYPNPFNPTTTIRFGIPESSNVEIVIYNMLGQKVSQLIDTKYSIGNHSIDFDGTRLSSGMYLFSINAVGESGKKFQSNKKMLLIK